jgi:transketolase
VNSSDALQINTEPASNLQHNSTISSELANQIRLNVLEVTYRTGSGHLGACLSIADILAVLYSDVLQHNPSQPNWSGRDYFILSKGHAALAEYSVLAQCGYFPIRDLLQFKQNGGVFSGMVSSKVPGVELSTGSLGQGVGFAAGLALGLRKENLPNHVFCLLGDGENDEGSVWEAVQFAGIHKLNNLTLIIDNNHQKIGGLVDQEPNYRVIYRGFGFETTSIDGHNHEQLLSVFPITNHSNPQIHGTLGKPLCIIANTAKGQGVSFLEAKSDNHNRPLNLAELKQGWQELGGTKQDFIDKKAEYAR